MTISWFQACLLGLFACLCSNSCMAGQAVGNYTIGRPLVGGLICGLILGNVPLGIACGAATQLVYIALVTPGGTVAADVRAISYIGIPLAMVAISSRGLNPFSGDAANLAKSLGTLVGTVGSVLFYAVAFMNLIWQAFGWKDIENNKLNRLYGVNFGWPWVSHLCFSFIPTVITALCIGAFRICWIIFYPAKTLFDTLICFPISWVMTSALFLIYYLQGSWLKKSLKQREKLFQEKN